VFQKEVKTVYCTEFFRVLSGIQWSPTEHLWVVRGIQQRPTNLSMVMTQPFLDEQLPLTSMQLEYL